MIFVYFYFGKKSGFEKLERNVAFAIFGKVKWPVTFACNWVEDISRSAPELNIGLIKLFCIEYLVAPVSSIPA